MSSTTPGGPGDGATPSQPPEPTHTAEQLAIIHAAMMEELGISRKDELPLADRGFDNAIPVRPIRQPVAGIGAAWHNLQFNDVDPADDELDSIADGQLYRLRRGDSYNSQQNNSRGRGGFAPRGGFMQRREFSQRRGFTQRGGHASSGRRGGRASHGRRGGHSSPGRGGGRDRDFGRCTSAQSTTPQKFFNDARAGVNNHTRIDEFIANLRADHTSANNPHRRKKKRGELALPQNHHNTPVISVANGQLSNSRESRRAQISTSSTWSLASSTAFLARIGVNTDARDPSGPASQPLAGVNNASSTERPTVTTPRVATQELPSRALGLSEMHVDANRAHPSSKGLASQHLPSEKRSSASTSGTSQPISQVNKENEISFGSQAVASSASPTVVATSQPIFQGNRDIENPFGIQSAGLSTSRWASEQPVHPAQPVRSEQPIRREIEREHGVSVVKDNNLARPGQARIWKTTPGYKIFTLELEIDGNIVVNEKVELDAHLSHDGDRAITYQAANEGQSPPVWKVLFRMPYMAKNFYQSLLDSLPSQPTGSLNAAGTLQLARSIAPGLPTTACLTINTQPSGNIELAAMASLTAIAEPQSILFTPALVAKSAPGDIEATSELASAFTAVDNSNIDYTHEQNDVMMSVETWGVPSKDLDQVLVELSFTKSPENSQTNGANRISSQVFREMSELAGVTPLVSFSDHEDDDEDETDAIPSAVKDLYDIDDSAAIEGMFSKLNNRPEGTFLQQLSAIVTEHGVPLVEQLSADDLRHSPWAKAYQLASQTVVSSFLSDSEIFKKLPDFMSLFWVTDKSDKILDKAIQQHEAIHAGEPEHPNDSIELMKVEEKVIKADPDVEETPIAEMSPAPFDHVQGLEKLVKTEQADVVRRAVFSIEELLEYRQCACEVRGELIEKEYLPPFYQAPRPRPAVREPSMVTSSDATLLTEPASAISAPSNTTPWQTFQVQQTDMVAWDAILNKKATNAGDQDILAASKLEIKQANPPRSTGHVPTNSDCDRLAQKLEGWHLDASLSEQQMRPETASSAIVDQARPMAPSTTNNDAAPPRPSSVASKSSTSASQSMTEKLTEASTVPLTVSPRIKTPIETINIRLQAIESQLNPPGIKNGNTSPAFERFVQGSVFSQSAREGLPTTENGTPQGPVTAAQETLLAAPDLKSSRSVSPAASLAVDVSPSIAHADHSPEPETPIPCLLSPRAQLRRGPGLSASRWATEDGNGHISQPSYVCGRASSSQLFGSVDTPAFQPSGHAGNMRFHSQQVPTPQIPLDFMSPGFAPVQATVITQDPFTGELKETKGFLKTGSVPVVAHMPVHAMGPPRNQQNMPMSMQQFGPPLNAMSPPRNQENVNIGTQSFVPAAPYNLMNSFPARPDMHSRHMSESSGSDVNFCNSRSPYGRMNPPANVSTSRQALSPVRGAQNNLQAELQSRLSNSLAARPNGNSPAK